MHTTLTSIGMRDKKKWSMDLKLEGRFKWKPHRLFSWKKKLIKI